MKRKVQPWIARSGLRAAPSGAVGIEGHHEAMDWGALAAFVSGVAAILSSMYALRRLKARDREECAERIEEIKTAFREGYQLRE